MTEDLVQRLRKRAEIRRQITTRKSVQNNEPDRISDLLEEAAIQIEALKKQVELLSNAFETVCDGMETSLELNKAQAERYWSEKK
jgi:phage host-nuclease inhibitor protein Gam